jgi:hypothetical protein
MNLFDALMKIAAQLDQEQVDAEAMKNLSVFVSKEISVLKDSLKETQDLLSKTGDKLSRAIKREDFDTIYASLDDLKVKVKDQAKLDHFLDCLDVQLKTFKDLGEPESTDRD